MIHSFPGPNAAAGSRFHAALCGDGNRGWADGADLGGKRAPVTAFGGAGEQLAPGAGPVARPDVPREADRIDPALERLPHQRIETSRLAQVRCDVSSEERGVEARDMRRGQSRDVRTVGRVAAVGD